MPKAITHRRFQGTVIKAAMQHTVVVRVIRTRVQPPYPKPLRVRRSFHVHDEEGKTKVGDVVTFEECRPLSRTKRWRLIHNV